MQCDTQQWCLQIIEKVYISRLYAVCSLVVYISFVVTVVHLACLQNYIFRTFNWQIVSFLNTCICSVFNIIMKLKKIMICLLCSYNLVVAWILLKEKPGKPCKWHELA